MSNVLDKNGDPIGALGDGEAVWHTDMSYLDKPPDASMLYRARDPAERRQHLVLRHAGGGCEALPDDLRRRLGDRRVKHDGTYNSGGYLRKGVTPTDDPMEAPGAWHPAILKHPANGRPTLYLGRRRNSYIEGLSRAESDALLEELWAHCTQPQFLYEHVWRLGDLVMWDNRSTMHRRDPFDGDGAPHHASHPDQGQRQAHRVCGVGVDSHSVVTTGAKRSGGTSFCRRAAKEVPPLRLGYARLRSGRRE